MLQMFFLILLSRISAFFKKTCNFASGVRKPPLGFDNKLLKKFIGHEIAFSFLYDKI